MRLPILLLAHIATAHRRDLGLTATTGEGSNTSSISVTALQNSTAVSGTHGSDRGVLSRAGPGKLVKRAALILAASTLLGEPLPAVEAGFGLPGLNAPLKAGVGLPSHASLNAVGARVGLPLNAPLNARTTFNDREEDVQRKEDIVVAETGSRKVLADFAEFNQIEDEQDVKKFLIEKYDTVLDFYIYERPPTPKKKNTHFYIKDIVEAAKLIENAKEFEGFLVINANAVGDFYKAVGLQDSVPAEKVPAESDFEYRKIPQHRYRNNWYGTQ